MIEIGTEYVHLATGVEGKVIQIRQNGGEVEYQIGHGGHDPIGFWWTEDMIRRYWIKAKGE